MKFKKFEDYLKEQFKSNKKVEDLFYKNLQSLRIADQIKQYRDKRGLGQEQLAQLIGTSQPTIARLEGGNYFNFSLRTLNKIAAALDIELVVSFKEKLHKEEPYHYTLRAKGHLGLIEEPSYKFNKETKQKKVLREEAV